jgi:putative transposase
MRYPAELNEPSARPYVGLRDLEYPFHDLTITITQCGRICMGARKIHLSTVFAGQKVGVKQVADRVWMVSFMDYDLGFFDDQTGRIASNAPRTPSAQKCYPCLRYKPLPMCPEWTEGIWLPDLGSNQGPAD